MKFKNILLSGLLLLTMQNSFAINYTTVGRKVFKTVTGIPLVTGVMTYEQSPAATKTNIAYHEACHAVVKTILEGGAHNINQAILVKHFGFIHAGQVESKDQKLNFDTITQSELEKIIKMELASIAGVAQNKKIRQQQYFLETELNLPLSRLTDRSNEIPTWGLGLQFNHDFKASVIHTFRLVEDFAEVQEMHNELYRCVCVLTKKHKLAIGRVAQALLEKGSLSGDEIQKLVYEERK